ncbi:MAG: hypothetical protein ACRDPM_04855 [Solirubrobacteraceae bacterium]
MARLGFDFRVPAPLPWPAPVVVVVDGGAGVVEAGRVVVAAAGAPVTVHAITRV